MGSQEYQHIQNHSLLKGNLETYYQTLAKRNVQKMKGYVTIAIVCFPDSVKT